VALIGQQRLEQVTYFRFVQRADVAAQRQRVAVGDRGADMGEEGGADDVVSGAWAAVPAACSSGGRSRGSSKIASRAGSVLRVPDQATNPT
jgi:hypothetical protein